DAKEEELGRVSQLTLRANKLNFTTRRRSESEIRHLLRDSRRRCLVTKVTDRFGDYGLVGVVIFETNEDRFEIDTCLRSCRAFGKGVEHQILWELARIAEHEGKTSIDISLIHTHRNQPAFDFINAIAWKHQHVEADCTLFKMPVRELRTLRYE